MERQFGRGRQGVRRPFDLEEVVRDSEDFSSKAADHVCKLRSEVTSPELSRFHGGSFAPAPDTTRPRPFGTASADRAGSVCGIGTMGMVVGFQDETKVRRTDGPHRHFDARSESDACAP